MDILIHTVILAMKVILITIKLDNAPAALTLSMKIPTENVHNAHQLFLIVRLAV